MCMIVLLFASICPCRNNAADGCGDEKLGVKSVVHRTNTLANMDEVQCVLRLKPQKKVYYEQLLGFLAEGLGISRNGDELSSKPTTFCYNFTILSPLPTKFTITLP